MGMERLVRTNYNLTDSERDKVLQFLLQNVKDAGADQPELKYGTLKAASEKFSCNRNTITNIWNRAKKSHSEGGPMDVKHKRKGRCGHKPIDRTANLEMMRRAPMTRRQTVRSLAHTIRMPVSSTFNLLKKQVITRVSSRLKPTLTSENEETRLRFAAEHVDASTQQFCSFMNTVHVDEKWFYLDKDKKSFYILPGEELPHRHCQSKRYLPKVMFLAAIARPRFDPAKRSMFNGLIGIWPFVYKEAAKRSSKNRPKGTLVTKLVQSITNEEYVNALVKKVIPAIREKWPIQSKDMVIHIQQDNAGPHRDVTTVKDELQKEGWNMNMKNQPPNSPDFNVLDLGFFNSIQSIQQKKPAYNVDELIRNVEEAFWSEPVHTTDFIFLSLMKAMESTMIVGGKNRYKLQHMNKEQLLRNGVLPESIRCSDEAFEAAMEKLAS